MNSLRQLLVFGAVAACLVLPSRAFGQISLTLKDDTVQVNGTIAAKDGKDKVRGKPGKVYTIDLTGGKTYQIDMTSKVDTAGKRIDPYLRLEDATLKELAHDDDSGGDLNARIIFKAPQDGKYRIIATTFGGGTGPFKLSIKPSEPIKTTEIALADGKGQVNGALAKEDGVDRVRTTSVCKVYAIKLSGGKTYQIDMISKDIDSYLRLEDATGKQLAEDDDGGGNLNARIVFNCPADGAYRIVATTFLGGAGPFTLTITQAQK
jgi:hypothetical protein